MKPDDVTDAMAEEMRKTYLYAWNFKDTIAASFNIVVSDAETITAEALVKMGWEYSERSGYYLHTKAHRLCWFEGQIRLNDGFDVIYLNHTKTIGQLRALHAGLGIGEVQL